MNVWMSDDTHSLMPSLEIMGSTPSMEVSSFSDLRIIRIFLQCSVADVDFPAEVPANDIARISAVDEVD